MSDDRHPEPGKPSSLVRRLVVETTNPRKVVLLVSAALLLVMMLYPPTRVVTEKGRFWGTRFILSGASPPVSSVRNTFLPDCQTRFTRADQRITPRRPEEVFYFRTRYELAWSRATLELIGWLTLTAVGIAVTGRKNEARASGD